MLANALGYIWMIVMNTLAIVLPLGGISTQALSERYDNPFTPIGFTFSIWSVIYLLLLLFTFIPLWQSWQGKKTTPVQKNITWLYPLSCLLNGLWIVTWHYQFIGVSVVIMVGLLVTLIRIHMAVRVAKPTRFDSIITLPAFSIYLGWISVATIANIAAWSVEGGWTGDLTSQIIGTNIMVGVATLLGATMFVRYRDVFFNLVIIWALYGIMSKRIMVDEVIFASTILVTQMCMAFLVGLISSQYLIKRK